MTREEREERREKLCGILTEANKAKDKLAHVANELEELGYTRKARSCMTLVYKIEAWQNSGT